MAHRFHRAGTIRGARRRYGFRTDISMPAGRPVNAMVGHMLHVVDPMTPALRGVLHWKRGIGNRNAHT